MWFVRRYVYTARCFSVGLAFSTFPSVSADASFRRSPLVYFRQSRPMFFSVGLHRLMFFSCRVLVEVVSVAASVLCFFSRRFRLMFFPVGLGRWCACAADSKTRNFGGYWRFPKLEFVAPPLFSVAAGLVQKLCSSSTRCDKTFSFFCVVVIGFVIFGTRRSSVPRCFRGGSGGGCTHVMHGCRRIYDHRPSHPYHAGTENVTGGGGLSLGRNE